MAVYVTVAFLMINGYLVTLDDVQMYDLTMGVAQNAFDLDKVAEILGSHLDVISLKDF